MEEAVTVKTVPVSMSSPFTDDELKKGEKRQSNPDQAHENPLVATVQSPAMHEPSAPAVTLNGQQNPRSDDDGWLVPLDNLPKESGVDNTKF